MRESVIWGAIVGIALGVTVTFALARGMLPLPWRTEDPVEAPRPAVLDLDARSSIGPALRSDPSIEPRRPTRPGGQGASASDGSLAAALPADLGLSRS